MSANDAYHTTFFCFCKSLGEKSSEHFVKAGGVQGLRFEVRALRKCRQAFAVGAAISRPPSKEHVRGRLIAAPKLSTKCRQLERQKWELPKKLPFLHRLYRERGLPSPLALSPCESDLFCMGLSTVCGRLIAAPTVLTHSERLRQQTRAPVRRPCPTPPCMRETACHASGSSKKRMPFGTISFIAPGSMRMRTRSV